MAKPYPDPIDLDGNINVHMLGGFGGAPVQIREGGRVINISALLLFFEIPQIGFRRALGSHPTDSMARMLPKMTAAECAAIPESGANYIIWDETGGERLDLWGGRFQRYQ